MPPLQVQLILGAHGHPQVQAMRAAVDTLRPLGDRTVTFGVPAAQVDRRLPAATPGPTPITSRLPAPGMAGRVLQMVPVADLVPDPGNIRDALGDVDELAASITEHGLLQPIVARREVTATGERLVIVAGHRRHAAVTRLAWVEVETIITAPMRSAEVLAAMLVENTARRDLDPIEEARALARLKAQLDCSSTQLASYLGRSQATIDNRLVLLDLDMETQELVRAGRLTQAAAVRAARTRAGRVRKSTPARFPHLSVHHPLASRARARCLSEHGRAQLVGRTACGECWESVIRADEQRTAYARSLTDGECVVCMHPVTRDPNLTLSAPTPSETNA